MGSVTLDVLRGSSMSVAGRTEISEISVLTPHQPITGIFPVFSVRDSQKIAEVQVAMMFEPLIASYDSSSSLPTTDASGLYPPQATDQGSVRSKTSRRSSSSHESSLSGKKKKKGKRFPSSSSVENLVTSSSSKMHSDAMRDVESDPGFGYGPPAKSTPKNISGQESSDNKHATDPVTRIPLSSIPSNIQQPSSHPLNLAHQERLVANHLSTLGRNTHPLSNVNQERLVPNHISASGHQERVVPDLISALLDRGKRLRDAMVKEELGHHPTKARPRGTAWTKERGGEIGSLASRRHQRKRSGDLLRELLQGGREDVPVRDTDPLVAMGNQEDDADDGDAENRAVELLVGDVLNAKELRNLKALQLGVSPPASVSSHSDDAFSEDEDPLHDNSILEDLFYKGVPSSSSESLADLLDTSSEEGESDVDGGRTENAPKKSSVRAKREKGGKRTGVQSDDLHSNSYLDNGRREDSFSRSGGRVPGDEEGEREIERGESSQSLSDSRTSWSSSLVSSRDAAHQHKQDQHPVDPASGLSVQRLTLLGRVHVARVTIDQLTLRTAPVSRIPVRVGREKGGRNVQGKPPRPATQKKITYFVEYQFPLSEASHPKNPGSTGTMATEVMRVVSKKISQSGKEVTFGHRSVFPIQFDGQVVDRWWKQLLVFKLFSKTAGDKHPTLLGVASIPLRSILQSPDLVTVADLSVKDKGSPSRRENRDDTERGSLIGSVSVSMELASDSKDFSSALAKTRVAEMQGAQIVPLSSSDPRAGLAKLAGQPSSSSSPFSNGLREPGQEPRGMTVHHTVTDGASQPNASNVGGTVHQTAQTPQKHSSAEGIISREAQDNHEALTLHSLLYIKEGHLVPALPPSFPGDSPPRPHPHPTQHALGGRDRVVHNAYLVGRMFWSDDAARSEVCWGTTQPSFDYVQVSPVLLTQSLLERMKNNFTVIEVWNKKTTAQHDQLLGIAKLPLHQLYMSYRDQRIARTLLKSQYPVVAVDSEIPITNLFTGQRCGQLTILLALGSQQQVLALQRLKSIRRECTEIPERPLHYAERSNLEEVDRSGTQDGVVEHVFEVVVESVQGLPQLEDSVWGEADCFIQYHFPHQQQQQQLQQQQECPATRNAEDGLTLRPHRTATTLCVPDPSFNDVSRHRLVLPQGTPVQRELLTACAGVGGHAGGIPFEVWCRFYYPNVRDQVIAKASLPLAKLCAMVTMQRRGEPSVQTFSLLLRTHQEQERDPQEPAGAKFQDGGLLDVTVSYKQTVVQPRAGPQPRGMHTHLATPGGSGGGPHASLALTIHRACGLKAAATALARYDNGMKYPSQVGVNSYIKIHLSFMAKDEVRVTRTVARSFSPEFNHFLELPCPLFLSHGEGAAGGWTKEEEGEVRCLAEVLESADLILQVWHQVPGMTAGGSDRPHLLEDVSPRGGVGGRGLVSHRVVMDTGDVLLGAATIPLGKLLANRTGMEGWYPIHVPPVGWADTPTDRQEDSDQSPSLGDTAPRPHPRFLDRVAGGVELGVKFGHATDRERVIDAGRKVGWSPDSPLLEEAEQLWDEGTGQEDSSLLCGVTVDVDAAWFPVQASLRPGQTQTDPHTKAYIRYKFYDKNAVCSKLCYLDQGGNGQLSAEFRHSQTIHARRSQPLAWYLREENLEVQLWLSYNAELHWESKHRPRHKDKLIGSAFIDLSPLGHQRSKRNRVSGLFPLFKPGSADMGGACLRAHVSMEMTQHILGRHVQFYQSGNEEEDAGSDDDMSPALREKKRQRPEDGSKEEEKQEEMEEERQKNQPVWMTVIVEKAMHLCNVADSTRLDGKCPCSYVTFQSAVGPSPAATPTVSDSAHPQWRYTRDIAVSPQLLDNQSLIFKVWHQVSTKQDQSCDRVLGFTSVDLGPLLAGVRSLDGWYNIMDFSGQILGQIKISITPKESLSPLRQKPKQRTILGSPNTSHLFSHVPLPPPHHLVSPRPQEEEEEGRSHAPSRHPAERSLDHFQQHLQGVREFHGKLQDRLKSLHRMETDATNDDLLQPSHHLSKSSSHPPSKSSHQPSQAGSQQHPSQPSGGQHHQPSLSSVGGSSLLARTPSTSYIMHTFRKNMEELDSLHQHLQSKLHGTGSMPASDHHRHDFQGAVGDDVNNTDDDGILTAARSGQIRTDRTMQGIQDDLTMGDGSNLESHSNRSNSGEEEEDISSGGSLRKQSSTDSQRPYETTERNLVDNPSSYGAQGGEEDRERDVVFVRPLNDVSSATFSNGVSSDLASPPFSSDAGHPDEDSLTSSVSGREVHHDGEQHGSLLDDQDYAQDTGEEAVGYGTEMPDRMQHSIRQTDGDAGYNGIPRLMDDGDESEQRRTLTPRLEKLGNGSDQSGQIRYDDLNQGHQRTDTSSQDESDGMAREDTLHGSRSDTQAGMASLGAENQMQGVRASDVVLSVISKDAMDSTNVEDKFSDSLSVEDECGSRRGEEEEEDFINDGIVLTLDAQEAELQRRQQELEDAERASEPAVRRKVPSQSAGAALPDFFLPPSDLEASMRALYNTVSGPRTTDRQPHSHQRHELTAREQEKLEAAQEMAQRLTSGSRQHAERSTPPFTFKQPTADQAKRIAKIFSTKF